MSEEVRTIDGQQVSGTVQNGTFFSDDGKLLVKPDGTVEHGFTDAQGYFHSARTVDGQTVYGFDTDDGGWISDDGKIAIDKGGKVEHGITDPNTHQFLPNGEVRTIDGHQIYGSVQDGTFYSEDGKLLVKPDGTVEHGFTDAQGYFHSARTVDGQTVYGFDTDDGGWISDDGKIAIDKGGKIEHGVTDPKTHQFLPNGTTHTLPDGTVLYGFNAGGDFYSADGTTIVLANGTVLHGTTDKNTGFFTPDNGNGVYVITDDGIAHGKRDPSDGAIVTDDGHRYMTSGSWAIDLKALSDAILAVQRERDNISTSLDAISKDMTGLSDHWQGPAYDSFVPVQTWYTSVTKDLMGILDDMIARMQKSYANYSQAENTNASNVTPA